MNRPCFLQNLTIVGATSAISIIGFGFSNLSAQAAVITNGCAAINQFCTLGEFFNGARILVGDKLFTQWDQITNSKNSGIVNTDNIQINGIFQDTNAPGLQFMSINNELEASGVGGRLTLEFDFLVISLGQQIVDNELELTSLFVTSVDGSNSLVQVGEKIGTFKGGDDLGIKLAFAEVNPEQRVLRDREVFPAQRSVWVRKKIDLITTGNGVAQLNKFEQRFSQVIPEPTSILGFLAVSLVGAASSFKQKLKRRN